VLDGGGVHLAATAADLSLRVRLVHLALPDLPVVPMGVRLRHGLIDSSLWQALVERARTAMPREVLLAVVARAHREGETLLPRQVHTRWSRPNWTRRAMAIGVRSRPRAVLFEPRPLPTLSLRSIRTMVCRPLSPQRTTVTR
jgi:hypothetical protein